MEELRVIQKDHGVCSVTCILTILNMILFCKQKEFNSEIIFLPISEYDFGYYIVNGQKCHFWLNAYFVKELHWICKCLWVCPKLKSLVQIFENEKGYINEMYMINGFGRASLVLVRTCQQGQVGLGGRHT